jgi:two-component SAPR family response regulator
MIRDLGGTVAGPVGRLDAARTVMRQEKINCAILDVKLDGDTSLPLVDDLIASGFPVILVSAYDSGHLPNRFADTPKLGKPVSVDELARALRASSKRVRLPRLDRVRFDRRAGLTADGRYALGSESRAGGVVPPRARLIS